MPQCGTGKRPNINVETQIPLELSIVSVLSLYESVKCNLK